MVGWARFLKILSSLKPMIRDRNHFTITTDFRQPTNKRDNPKTFPHSN